MRYPDLICLGAQKSATTWLYDVLKSVPNVYVPPIKELHYYSQIYNSDARKYGPQHRLQQAGQALEYLLRRGEGPSDDDIRLKQLLDEVRREDVDDEWYRRIFAEARADEACVEVCPSYMNMPLAGVQHVFRLNPVVRLLVLVRDPIDRCWSQIRMHISRGSLSRDLARLVSGETSLWPYLFYTDYAAALRRWEAFAAPGQLKIMLHEDVEIAPYASLAEILDLVALSPPPQSTSLDKQVFSGEHIELPAELRRKLLIELTPQYEYLKSLFPVEVEAWLARHNEALA